MRVKQTTFPDRLDLGGEQERSELPSQDFNMRNKRVVVIKCTGKAVGRINLKEISEVGFQTCWV